VNDEGDLHAIYSGPRDIPTQVPVFASHRSRLVYSSARPQRTSSANRWLPKTYLGIPPPSRDANGHALLLCRTASCQLLAAADLRNLAGGTKSEPKSEPREVPFRQNLRRISSFQHFFSARGMPRCIVSRHSSSYSSDLHPTPHLASLPKKSLQQWASKNHPNFKRNCCLGRNVHTSLVSDAIFQLTDESKWTHSTGFLCGVENLVVIDLSFKTF